MLKKMNKVSQKLALFGALAIMGASQAHAVGVAYFTMPATFQDDVTATIVGIAGILLALLGLMFAWRKTVKSTNRS